MKRGYKTLLLSLIVPFIASCGRSPGGAPGMGALQQILDVMYVHPVQVTVTNWDIYPGYLEAVHTVQIKAQVGGYLHQIHFKDGQFIKKGDLLFTIDPRPYEVALQKARAERERAEIALRQAEDNLKRAEKLQGTKAISEEEFDNRQKAAEIARANLESAKAAERQAELNLEYTQIIAPVEGRIGRRLVSLGDYIQAGMMGTVMAELVTINPIYAYFDVPEDAFLTYRKLTGGLITNMICELQLPGEGGFLYRGRIDFYNNQVSRDTGTIMMRAVFENLNGSLIPGLYCQIRLPVGEPETALVVPAIAVVNQQGRDFVYVINNQDEIDLRPVVTGRIHGEMRIVKSGLSLEERVAIGRLLMLRPGMKVKPIQANLSSNFQEPRVSKPTGM